MIKLVLFVSLLLTGCMKNVRIPELEGLTCNPPPVQPDVIIGSTPCAKEKKIK